MTERFNKNAARAICDAATPVPWRQGSVEKYHVFVACDDVDSIGLERVLLKMNTHFPYEHDAAFIARSRVILPRALDRIDELEAALQDALALTHVPDHSQDDTWYAERERLQKVADNG